jgi:hypothetical protein
MTKIEEFQCNLRQKILTREITTNFEALDYAYSEGHIASHAAECIKLMKKNREIDYSDVAPKVNYENVYKKQNKVLFHVLKK